MEFPLTHPGAPSSRRDFFKRASLGVGVVAAASALQACDSTEDDSGADVTLDFSSDVGVLNYAYALEQLEAAFYAQVVATPYAGITDTERAVLQDLAKHEAIHDQFFRVAITAAAPSQIIPRLNVDFSSINFASRASVLGTAQVFEDLGVGAYNGAGQYITSDTYLLLAGKIVSVEARHASVISGLLAANSISGSGQINAQGLDKALDPRDVLAAAGTYIQETIGTSGLPPR
ncbi:MAG TPA: ferritin-like domain-containing protein [Rubricoccaceae bacterium]